MEVRRYETPTGSVPFQEWLTALEDPKARVAIVRRIDRLEQGNRGDCRFCGEGVWELRIDLGPGYRIYYGVQDTSIMVLLCAGSKRTQFSDITKAMGYWRDFRRRQYDS